MEYFRRRRLQDSYGRASYAKESWFRWTLRRFNRVEGFLVLILLLLLLFSYYVQVRGMPF